MALKGRAPVRIDFAGGWTDVEDYCLNTPGYVLSIAVNIYSNGTLLPFGTEDKNKIEIVSSDFKTTFKTDNINDITYEGKLDLIKAAVKKYSQKGGFKLITQSNAPPGSGLGSSAAIGVTAVGLITAFNNASLLPHEIAEAASSLEKNELHIIGGKQDQYASVLGGINFLEFRGKNVKASPLTVEQDILSVLRKNLILCYTGQSRLSGDIHFEVKKRFESGNVKTLDAIENLKSITQAMKKELINGNFSKFGYLIQETWENQKQLHPSVTNPEIDDIFNEIMKSGAYGGKACGAGGGGCLVFFSKPGKENVLKKILEKRSLKRLDFDFDFEGFKIWEE